MTHQGLSEFKQLLLVAIESADYAERRAILLLRFPLVPLPSRFRRPFTAVAQGFADNAVPLEWTAPRPDQSRI